MKTIRTMLATLAGVFLVYGLFALIVFKGGAPLGERSLYQVFGSSYFVMLVMGVAMLLVTVLLTIAIVSFKEDKEDESGDEEDEDDSLFPKNADAAPIRPPAFTQISEKPPAPLTEPPPAEPETGGAPPSRFGAKPFVRPLTPNLFAEEDEAPASQAPPPLRIDLRRDVSSLNLPENKSAYSRPSPQAQQCAFCGEAISGTEAYCPYCGKKVTS